MTVIGHGYDDNVGAPAYRNLIINGGMSVAQRNPSVPVINAYGSGYYTADRWLYTQDNTVGTWTQSVENDAPTDSGFRKSLKMFCTTANSSLDAGDFISIDQRLEGQNLQHFLKGTSAAKKFAVSFWVKSNVTGTYIINLRDTDNTRFVASSYSISASGIWEKKTIIFPADTTGVFDNDNALSLSLQFALMQGSTYTSGTLSTTWGSETGNIANRFVGQTNLGASANNYWQVTGVQLEPEVVTPFEFEPYETTLRKCQRYYQIVIDSATNFYQVIGSQYYANAVFARFWFPTRMRAVPNPVDNTLRVNIYSAGVLSEANAVANFAFNYADPQGMGVQFTTAGDTAGRAVHLDWASGSLHANAEL